MTERESKKQKKDETQKDSGSSSTETRSGNPNAEDPTDNRTSEHRGGYGGEGGAPRTSSNEADGK